MNRHTYTLRKQFGSRTLKHTELPYALHLALTFAIVLSFWTTFSAPAHATSKRQQISLVAGQLLKDGEGWHPKGVVITGRVTPPPLLQRGFIPERSRLAAAKLGADTFKQVKAFGADAVVLSASQGALDPSDPIHSPSYLRYLLDAVELARENGLVAIITLSAQPGSGALHRRQMPSSGTLRAWGAIASQLCNERDNGIVLNLFNEPSGGWNTPQQADWEEWQENINGAIAALRKQNCQNVIIVQSLKASKELNFNYPIVDPLKSYIWGIHVYFNCGICGFALATTKLWDAQFGRACKESYENLRIPCIIDEWGLGSGDGRPTGCVGNAPEISKNFLAWVRQSRPWIIGVTGWAFDAPNQLIQADGTPTDFSSFASCATNDASFGIGALLSDYFREK